MRWLSSPHQLRTVEKFKKYLTIGIVCSIIIIEREVVIMSNKIFEMLDLFYANKHLYEKIKKKKKNLDK